MIKKQYRKRVDLDVVELDEFLALVPTEEVSDETSSVKYSTLTRNEDPRSHEGQDVAVFEYMLTPIVYGEKLTVLRSSLMHQGQLKTIPDKGDFEDAMVLEHMYEFGAPTHLVKVDDRVWMVANPKDFKIAYTSEGAYGLLLLAHVRTKLYTK